MEIVPGNSRSSLCRQIKLPVPIYWSTGFQAHASSRSQSQTMLFCSVVLNRRARHHFPCPKRPLRKVASWCFIASLTTKSKQYREHLPSQNEGAPWVLNIEPYNGTARSGRTTLCSLEAWGHTFCASARSQKHFFRL